MAMPHIDAILAHHPEGEISLLTTAPYRSLFDQHPRIQAVVLDRSQWFSPESARGRKGWVKAQRFDVVYDLQGNRTSRMLTRASGAAKRVGKASRSVYNCYPPADDPQRHIFDRLNVILSAAGLPDVSPHCTLYPSKEDIERVERWKKKHGLINEKYIILHAGSSPEWPSKQWPAFAFSKLSFHIEQCGYPCVWIGGKSDEGLNRGLAAKSGIDATGKFSFLQLYLLGTSAAAAVTNDSGPMHILAAADTPVYSLFGPTNWFKHHAVGQRDRVIYHPVGCSPCYKKVCPPKHRHACLDGIQPKQVFRRIQNDLQL